jgi:hypothetical protein
MFDTAECMSCYVFRIDGMCSSWLIPIFHTVPACLGTGLLRSRGARIKPNVAQWRTERMGFGPFRDQKPAPRGAAAFSSSSPVLHPRRLTHDDARRKTITYETLRRPVRIPPQQIRNVCLFLSNKNRLDAPPSSPRRQSAQFGQAAVGVLCLAGPG